MTNQHKPRISLAILILCLCLGSLVILPLIQVGPSTLEISRIDAGIYGLFEHTEFDDDFFVISMVGGAIAELNFSKSGQMNLDFQSTTLSPVSPPPRSS